MFTSLYRSADIISIRQYMEISKQDFYNYKSQKFPLNSSVINKMAPEIKKRRQTILILNLVKGLYSKRRGGFILSSPKLPTK